MLHTAELLWFRQILQAYLLLLLLLLISAKAAEEKAKALAAASASSKYFKIAHFILITNH
jgi:hypothetical protein